MTKRVQLAGGSAELEQVLVGLERELRVDLDNDALRLHDGVKEGGYLFLNRDANDTRYQARSLELDGFSFPAQGKGLLVRVGPAAYKLRKLTANVDEFVITNPRGTAGDFYFELAAVINTDHEWTGIQTFDEQIIASGGVLGNVIGNLTGGVTGTFNGDGTGTFAGELSGDFVGNVDVRGHTILFDDGQIPESALDPDILVNRGVPLGAILLWSGTIDTIPASWALCDGTNGTPNLSNKFILGAGAGVGIAGPLSAGGSSTVTLTGTLAADGDHTHPLAIDGHALTVAEMPAHTHDVACGPREGDTATNFTNGDNAVGIPVTTSSTGSGDSHTHTGTASTSGSHTHDLTLDDVTVIPPYYALCYIMKIV